MSSITSPEVNSRYADKFAMQHRLFVELSSMFGREVPLYDKSLMVNKICNRAVCNLLEHKFRGFSINEEQLDKTSGERHGAIRIGTAEEYKWVAGFFDAFALLPHNFYDMTSLGAKSQPIIATAFRSPVNPEHRVFCSLLMIDYFESPVRERVEKLLSERQVFSDRAKELILKNEEQGGLDELDAEELISEGTSRIFKWTGSARNHQLYRELCESGFKIAADIACFQSHHLNHLTPNTFCMDLFTAAMKYRMGELNEEEFSQRASRALKWLQTSADANYMKLHFRHLTLDDIEAFEVKDITENDISALLAELIKRLKEDDVDLTKLKHSGFKDFTEGPDTDTPILLRQDSYKALTEPVTFYEPDGSTVDTVHTARFGEIEQRFYATTPQGRELYDRCLAEAEANRQAQPELARNDYFAYLESYGSSFRPFPKDLRELLRQKLVFGRFSASPKGLNAAGSHDITDLDQLIDQGYVRYEGLRYEDFLPFSAAGIFASNLGQYGTKSGQDDKPQYSQAMLQEIMGRPIVDPNVTYKGLQSESLIETYKDLELYDKLPEAMRSELESDVAALRVA